ncbi:MAG TPA: hypothetical protein VGV89_09005 [Thermoplasmata archaeon]|nr:hypothetical protein [Thermoplasmata archaeon]
MTDRVVLGILVAVAVVAAGVAFASGGDVAAAVPAALIGTGAAAAAAGLALADRLRWRPPVVVAPDTDPSVALRDGLRGGAFGRQNAIAHLRALERRFPTALAPLSAEEAERAVKLSRREFLKWAEARVARLEAAT